MTAVEQRTALVDLARAEARIGELRLRVLAAADCNDIAADSAPACGSARRSSCWPTPPTTTLAR